MAEDLGILKKKRGTIKTQITKFQTYVNNFTDPTKYSELEVRLEKAQLCWVEFDTIQSQIENLADKDDPQEAHRDTFEDLFFSVIAKARDLLNVVFQARTVGSTKSNNGATAKTADSGSSTNTTNSTASNISVKLPKLKLFEFDGNYEKWSQFKDTFKSIIHNNTSLSCIQKYYYLISCLKGDALKAISALQTTEENYAVAWTILKDRFENERVSIHHHIRAIFELPQLSKEFHVGLRGLYDELTQHLRALESLGQPVNSWDSLIIHLLSSKLDGTSKREWEKSVINVSQLPTSNDLKKFLNQRCQLLERLASDKNIDPKHKRDQEKPFLKSERQEKTMSHLSANHIKCNFCKGSHYIHNCREFLKLPIDKRMQEVKTMKLCNNCLRDNHFSKQCRASNCKKCGKRHNSLLHLEESNNSSDSRKEHLGSNSTTPKSPDNSTNSVSVHVAHGSNEPYVILATAEIMILDSEGKARKCRALLDNGSQSNFITHRLSNQLNLPRSKVDIPVCGVNQSTTNVTFRTRAEIMSNHNNFKINLSLLVVDEITQTIPMGRLNIDHFNLPANVTLADPHFYEPRNIDILLGAGVFWELLCVGQIRLGKNLPCLQKSKLGWIISGPLLMTRTKPGSICQLSVNRQICDQLEKFWRVEECLSTPLRSKEEVECEQHFVETTQRDQTGRFVVSLPFRDNISQLGGSIEMATKRFYALERKLSKNSSLKQQYSSFMSEYENLGHMSKIDPSDLNLESGVNYYMPHHSVIRDSSSTTKLRVVFDASATTSSNLSLNDTLKVGPVIQDDLFAILLRFRTHAYVIIADIEKMYRQVLVRSDDRDFQRIVWRENPTDTLSHFRLNTVTYGTTSASFLAIRSLQQTALDHNDVFPKSSSVILKDFYVDDLITGADSIEEAEKIIHEVKAILKTGSFPLRKWIFNDKSLYRKVSPESQGDENYLIDEQNTKALGLLWNSCEDILFYDVNISDKPRAKVTKRTILSTTAQIFDPLGLISPVIITAKILLQKIWQLGIHWDESVPADVFTLWTRFCDQVVKINQIKIPRHSICAEVLEIQIHIFSDASEVAYGACAYFRTTDIHGNVQVRLLCSKSRVAPLKTITLPRLELCGALLAARLGKKILESLNHIELNPFYWCDSTIVLSWIALEANQLKTFVSHRVAELQDLTGSSSWNHVKSEDNPADLVSRGTDPTILSKSKLWWEGPHWLSLPQHQWYLEKPCLISEPIERKTKIVTLTSYLLDQEIFKRYSSLLKLQRVIAYCLRFHYNTLHQPNLRNLSLVTIEELDQALLKLSKIAQSGTFSAEIHSLQRYGAVSPSNRLASLSPWLDEHGILRVGGRIRNSNLPHDNKHPILIASKHAFTTMIIMHEHIRHLHAGNQATLAAVRSRFWPINGRSSVRSVLRNCMVCFKANPVATEYKMGDLPSSRLRVSRPFSTVGIDFAGPFYVKDGKLRNRQLVKCYMCVFVCFSTKAVHLELAGDMSSDTFLNTLKRFFARRGLCKEIHSDNGTNFVGASRELKEITDLVQNINESDQFLDFFHKNNITWHFIPQNAPNFGGLWESCVKSAKHHLHRVLSNAHLTFEQLYTIIVQVESILNSRPLMPMSNDPNDLDPLTPGHFLIGEALLAVPQHDVCEIPSNRLDHYQRLQQLLQEFWKRWRNEYLTTLQQRPKWRNEKEQHLKEGSLVLLKDDNTAPLNWKTGRVVKLYPGSDHIIRVADVKTINGTFKRPLTKICILPFERNDSTVS